MASYTFSFNLDSLRKLEGTQLTSVLGEILNLNRVRTSALGNAVNNVNSNPAKRNIVA